MLRLISGPDDSRIENNSEKRENPVFAQETAATMKTLYFYSLLSLSLSLSNACTCDKPTLNSSLPVNDAVLHVTVLDQPFFVGWSSSDNQDQSERTTHPFQRLLPMSYEGIVHNVIKGCRSALRDFVLISIDWDCGRGFSYEEFSEYIITGDIMGSITQSGLPEYFMERNRSSPVPVIETHACSYNKRVQFLSNDENTTIQTRLGFEECVCEECLDIDIAASAVECPDGSEIKTEYCSHGYQYHPTLPTVCNIGKHSCPTCETDNDCRHWAFCTHGKCVSKGKCLSRSDCLNPSNEVTGGNASCDVLEVDCLEGSCSRNCCSTDAVMSCESDLCENSSCPELRCRQDLCGNCDAVYFHDNGTVATCGMTEAKNSDLDPSMPTLTSGAKRAGRFWIH